MKVDELKIQQKVKVQELQTKNVAVIDAKMRYISQLQNHGNELMEMIYYIADKVGEQQKITRNASKSAIIFSKLAEHRLVEMNNYRDKLRNM